MFLPTIKIDHIDPGGTEYTTWKQKVAGDRLGVNGGENWLNRVMMEYRTGKRPLYWKDDYNKEDGKWAQSHQS